MAIIGPAIFAIFFSTPLWRLTKRPILLKKYSSSSSPLELVLALAEQRPGELGQPAEERLVLVLDLILALDLVLVLAFDLVLVLEFAEEFARELVFEGALEFLFGLVLGLQLVLTLVFVLAEWDVAPPSASSSVSSSSSSSSSRS